MPKPSKTEGFFTKKQDLSRKELRNFLREDSGVITGIIGERYRRSERVRLEQTVFDRKKYGAYISKQEFERAVRRLRGQRSRLRSEKERLEIDKKIRYLKRIGGI